MWVLTSPSSSVTGLLEEAGWEGAYAGLCGAAGVWDGSGLGAGVGSPLGLGDGSTSGVGVGTGVGS